MIQLRKLLLSLSLLASLAGFSVSSHAVCNVYGYLLTQAQYDALPSEGYGPVPGFGAGNWYWKKGWTGRQWSNCSYVGETAESSYSQNPINCSAPNVRNSTGTSCVPGCTVTGKTHLPASSPLCVADPQCLEGEVQDGMLCRKDCSQAQNIGTSDYMSAYNGQCPANEFVLDGCKYQAANMVQVGGGGTYECYFYGPFMATGQGVLTGIIADGQLTPQTDPTPAALPPSSGNPPVSPMCPSGYSWDASKGGCVKPAVPGTPAGPDSPATPGEPEKITCPVGSSMVGDSCVWGVSPPAGVGCPSGSVLNSQGKCEILGSVTGDASVAGNCGAPGQPPCKFGLDLSEPPADGTAINNHTFSLSSVTKVDITAPAAQCPADVQLPHGIVFSWQTICDFALHLRPFILAFAWLAAGMFVLGGRPS